MKFTLSWLKEYLDTQANCSEILNKLDQIGLEVDVVVDDSKKFKDFNCVEVIECNNHLDSDHLHICKVKKVDGEILQIVCGAPNAKSGMKAVLAPVGSIIPSGDFEIKKSKIRGVESCGMLCSEKELGLGEDHSGIIELSSEIELGKNVADIYGLNDPMIDLNLLQNTAHCLGVYGIARDLSATSIGKLREFKNHEIKSVIPSPFRVEIQDENCPEFTLRYIKGIKNCESPDWIKQRLKAVGINPKSALVDITNYVMLVLNRPLHCYDADKINGNLVVKKANGGEKFLALDKIEYIMPQNATLICDTNSILGLGGIIGGEKSASSDKTTNVVLECAVFDPLNIARTARALNIITDAKFRFERGIDQTTTELALNYATYLIQTICGGESSEIVRVISNSYDENLRIMNFPISCVELFLGLKIERQKIIEILKNLGYGVEEDVKDLNILILTLPTWRPDISVKETVIEDIIRVYGYDNLKEIKINNEKISETQEQTENRNLNKKLWDAGLLLAANGMTEIISWSFMKEDVAKEFAPINEKLRVKNPITADLSYMKPSIIPNLLTIAKNNQDRGTANICIFEKSRVFMSLMPEGQKRVIGGIRTGTTCEKDVFSSSRAYDIFDVKKDLFDVLRIFGISADALTITNDVPDYYHPARSGAIKMGNIFLGSFGEIHPLKTNILGLKNKVNAFELFLDNIPKQKEQKATQKKKYIINDLQNVSRDFAFILDCDVEVGKVIDTVKKVSKELIKEVHIFDIYQGKNMEEGKKSIAFSIKLQPTERTLNGEEIDGISNKIIKDITEKLGGVLRDK
ncbi:MAG: phenylalanine--tRNA ligase subunit beta [Rickettsiales bacterium]|nr:phenylalanine--tRNA ligase subunit beta [Rickettsiales bacterium]